MERGGSTLPLLIGGATTSRQHTAVKIAPEYGRRPCTCSTRRAWSASSARCSTRPRRRRSTRRTGSSRSGCASCTPSASGGRCCRSPARARTAHADRWHAEDSRRRRSPARAIVEPTLAELRAVHRLDVLLPRLGAEGSVPGDPRPPEQGEAARELFDAANELLDDIVAREAVRRARRLRLLAGAVAEGDDVVARDGTASCGFPMLRQQARRTATRGRTGRSPTSSPRRDGPATTSARSPSRIHGADELAARFEAEQRRLQRDHGQGAGRPARRGVRRVAARAGAARLVRAGRAARA